MKYRAWISLFCFLILAASIAASFVLNSQQTPAGVIPAITAFLSAIAIFFINMIQGSKLNRQNRKIEEQRLLTARFSNYYEYASDAMFLFDEKVVIDCNNRTLQMFRCKREDMINRSPVDFSPEIQPCGKTSQEMADEIFRRGRENNKIQLFEWRHKRLDGTLFDTEVSYSLIEIDGRQIPQAIVRDITERKENEAELDRYRKHLEDLVRERTEELEDEARIRQKAEEEMRQIFKIAGDGLALFNVKTGVSSVNDRMMKICGKTQEQLISAEGHSCLDFGHTPGDCPVDKIMNNPSQQIEYDGKIGKTPYIITLVPYHDRDGQLHGVVQSMKDISDRVKAEAATAIEAEQRGRIMMTSDMLHDIGNALAGINVFQLSMNSQEEWQEIISLNQLKDFLIAERNGLIQLVGEEKQEAITAFIELVISSLKNRRKKGLDSEEQLSRTVKHISAILDLHRYYARSSQMVPNGIVNIRQLLNDAMIILSCNIEKRNIKIETEVSGENHLVSGDRTRLMRMFLNVIKNSYEAFSTIEDKRKRTLRVTLKEIKGDNQIEVGFTDNASGFSAETRKDIFERGFTTKDSGSGIGLPECWAIAESHQGKISIYSEGEGCGASVIIRLPQYQK